MSNKNSVSLIGFYGSDNTHAQSAWVSTDRTLTEEKSQRIDKLLNMLAKEGHHTPFEKSSLHFLVTSSIDVHIQALKHRIGVSINSESARYKELKEDKIYLPEDWKGIKRTSSNINFSENIDWYETLENFSKLGNDLYHQALSEITPILGRKRAKESARYFKSYNSQITYDMMFNFRSFAHFQNLRNSEHSQKEIREIAIMMLNCIKTIPNNPFKHTLNAFNL